VKARPVILHVGGTDPSGGAGLAADIKSCAALGGHGCLTVTAVTVQNSGGVSSWVSLPADVIAAQMETTCDDGVPDAWKTGMLGGAEAVRTVSDVIERRMPGVPYVLDPVMIAGSGDDLAEAGLKHHITRHLIPLATLVTPNLDEAEAFTGMQVRTQEDMEKAALAMGEMGAQNVLLKGGHLRGDPADVLVTSKGIRWFPGRRIVPGKVHGTGCTLASSCATLLGGGYSIEEAVERSLSYLGTALSASFNRQFGTLLGHFSGMGPISGSEDRSAFYRTPRFCPACRGELISTPSHPVCSLCGLVYYRNPLPAVILVVESKGRLLVARRALAPAMGELSLPGGFIDPGESPEQAAIRELKEETSLEASSLLLLAADRDSTDYGSVVLYVYRVTDWKGSPEPADDVSELKWMNLEDIPSLAFPAHDRVIEALRTKGLT